MGNTEAKGQSIGEKLNEESKGGTSSDNREILNQLVESDFTTKLMKEKSDLKRMSKSGRDSTSSLRKKAPQNLDIGGKPGSPARLSKGLKENGRSGENSGSPQRLGQNKIVQSPHAVSQYAATMLKSGRVRTSNSPGRDTTQFAPTQTQEDKFLTERRRELLEKRKKAVLLQSRLNYSNSDLVDIKTLLNQETLSSSDPNQILFEGELLKYKPGTSFNWVERWCRVTRSAFMYYKNEWSSNCWDLKPLAVIPIREVVAIFRVNLDLPNHKTQQPLKLELTSVQSKYKELFQFEIFSELTDYPYKDEVAEEDSSEEPPIDEKKKERFPADNEEKKIAQQIDVSKLEGFKLWDDYQERKQRESPANARKKGYLMRPPMTQKSYKKTHESAQQTREAATREYLEVAYGVQHNLAKTNSPQRAKQVPVTDNFSSPAKKKMLPENKNSPARQGATYKWVKDSGDLTSWSGREREWFYSEKRLLFACPNVKERETWVAVLNWVFEKMMSEEYNSKINTVEDG